MFRDYAQGAWRMRQFGYGQKLTVILVKEVEHLIENATAKEKAATITKTGDYLSSLSSQQLLSHIVGWLILNSMKAENLQSMALAQQELALVWRRQALQHLLSSRCAAQMQSDAGIAKTRFFNTEDQVQLEQGFAFPLEVFTTPQESKLLQSVQVFIEELQVVKVSDKVWPPCLSILAHRATPSMTVLLPPAATSYALCHGAPGCCCSS